jgi:acyl CoA:acetate/3-ketoacid CoA transferase alpha subunit
VVTIVSVDPADVEARVEIVATVRVGTGDVTLVKAKRAAHLGNLRQRSVVDLVGVVARHRLRDLSSH